MSPISLAQKQKSPKSNGKSTTASSVTANVGVGLVAGAARLPQVNLLPQSVRAHRAMGRLKVLLGIAVLSLLALAVVAWLAAAANASSAQDALDKEQSRTTALLREQAQYSAVPQIKGQIDSTRMARDLAVVFDVDWAPMSRDLYDAMPRNSVLTTIDVSAMSPMVGAPAAPDAVTPQGIATVRMSAQSPELIDTTTWLTSLRDVSGVLAPSFTAQTLEEDADGDPVYTVEAQVQIDVSVLQGRFEETN